MEALTPTPGQTYTRAQVSNMLGIHRGTLSRWNGKPGAPQVGKLVTDEIVGGVALISGYSYSYDDVVALSTYARSQKMDPEAHNRARLAREFDSRKLDNILFILTRAFPDIAAQYEVS